MTMVCVSLSAPRIQEDLNFSTLYLSFRQTTTMMISDIKGTKSAFQFQISDGDT